MTDEFKKARDKQSDQLYDSGQAAAFDDGADWGYKWGLERREAYRKEMMGQQQKIKELEKNYLTTSKQLHKVLDQRDIVTREVENLKEQVVACDEFYSLAIKEYKAQCIALANSLQTANAIIFENACCVPDVHKEEFKQALEDWKEFNDNE